ncbi:sensor histidine kinase MtrB [Tsukamurella pulmonis]|uniref:Sensor histidine kinase MtrB n=1 Tax=Tsukamurella pulmonis TaxID=47312 RepID=A0A1H1GTR0_9ACTN|nr:sensor histidine kinase MtrB [Tsukamurella pulmonis]SDR16443.1 two-component system, OmpR family, sensor histidine kinase MtrB [Tsukamurella pulmonis]SUP16664.1 Alkaline phosphatase synthesis sensor protein phoR [Tsukamurella pulmonis]
MSGSRRSELIGRARTAWQWLRRRDPADLLGDLMRLVGAALSYAGRMWRRSLQLRVVTQTLVLSLTVLLLLGFVLTSQITNQLINAKLAAGEEETARVKQNVEVALGRTEPRTEGVESVLRSVRSSLVSQGLDVGPTAARSGNYDPVLIVPNGAGRPPTVLGSESEVPQSLQNFVRSGQASYQHATVTDSTGRYGKVMVIGTPVQSTIAGLELYLVFPLTQEENTLNLMQGTLYTGGAVLVLLLAAVSLLVARQVVLPVRSAARIAVRFAEGRLKERMPVRGEDDIARLAMSFNDMAESLSKQIGQLEEFGDLQRQFTSDVSHELRTPLTTVRMAADMIADSADELDPGLRRTTELMVKELDRFETLLAELLEISRHDAGVAELHAERIDIEVPIASAMATVRHLAEQSETELILDMPDDPVIVEADTRRVERVLRNLLANAIDHSEGKPVILTMRADDDAVAVTVRDYGVGLRPGEEKLVFNRFWRSDPSRVRRSGGTGLGLAISIEDARLHSGRLEAWGEPGSGSCFRLTLPRTRGGKVTVSPLPLKSMARRGADGSSDDA